MKIAPHRSPRAPRTKCPQRRTRTGAPRRTRCRARAKNTGSRRRMSAHLAPSATREACTSARQRSWRQQRAALCATVTAWPRARVTAGARRAECGRGVRNRGRRARNAQRELAISLSATPTSSAERSPIKTPRRERGGAHGRDPPEEAKAEHKLKRQYNAVNMLQQVYFEVDASTRGTPDEARALVDHRDHQRFLLRHLLTLPEDTYAKDPLLDEPDVFTIQFIQRRGSSCATSPPSRSSAARGTSRGARGSCRQRRGRSGRACARR